GDNMASTPAEVLTEVLRALSNGDIAAIDGLLSTSHPVLFVGTDPAEWWNDRAHILEVFEVQIKEMGLPSADVGEIESGQAGNAGWAAAQPVLRIPDGPEIAMR